MDFTDRIRKLGDRIHERKPHIHTEEATKQSLIIPFIRELGYDIYNPAEVVPEYTADLDTRKGEKVDYAILKDGSPIILIECKDVDVTLGREQRSQLTRYFMVTRARYAILTNGIIYQFFTELDEKNQMDITPFLIIDMENLDERLVRELEYFTKDAFDADKIFSSARELRFMRDIGREIAAEFREPSRDLVRHFAKQVYSGPLTKPRMEEFSRFVREALRQHVNDQVRSRLQSAILSESEVVPEEEDEPVSDIPPADGLPNFSEFQYWNQTVANEELHSLFMVLHDFIVSLGEETWVEPNKSAFSVKRERGAFFTVFYFKPQPGRKRLRVELPLDPATVQLEEGFTRDRNEGRGLEITIRDQDDLERAKPLLKRSYDESG